MVFFFVKKNIFCFYSLIQFEFSIYLNFYLKKERKSKTCKQQVLIFISFAIFKKGYVDL